MPLNSVADEWRSILIVITADCDLAHEKHGGALTCVPVLPVNRYLLDFRFEKIRAPIARRILESAQNVARSQYGSTSNVSSARMRSWLIEQDINEIASSLCPKGDGELIIPLLTAARRLLDRPDSVADAVRRLAEAKLALGDAKSEDRAMTASSNEFAAALRNLPGDVLLLTELSPAHSAGYVAYLRRCIELSEQAVALTLSRISHQATHVRASRLRAPYVYALTQQFASVFAAIGLPDAYDEACKLMGEKMRSEAI